MPRPTTRKIELFSLSGHVGQRPVSYARLLDAVKQSKGPQRVLDERDRVIAITRVSQSGRRFYLDIDHGPKGYNPLILNTSRMSERVATLAASEVVVMKTHAVVCVRSRVMAIEYVHAGAKAKHIARAIESAARSRLGKNLAVELSPIASSSFAEALKDLDSIKVASIKLARPNPSWGDRAEAIESVGDDSDAGAMEINLFARRASSLSRVAGMVKYIKGFVRRKPTNLQSAKIIGTRQGSPGRVSVNLENHVEHRRVSVERTSDGHVSSSDMRGLLRRTLSDHLGENDDA